MEVYAAKATLAALTMAMAVLRFSDLDRTKGIKLNDDCMYGQTWRSKSQATGMPWAMPRHTWQGYDLGGLFYKQMEQTFQTQPDRNWQWPAMILDKGTLQIEQPVRHGSYANCLAAHNVMLRAAGVEGDFTLHSPRFFVPGLAGQAGMTMEQRRALGHWGPHSDMPARYDRSRCCTELRMKAELWSAFQSGFEPKGDFRIPGTERREAKEQRVDMKKVTNPNTEGQKVILNNRSMVLHRADPDDCMKSACPHARTKKDHFQATIDAPDLHFYVRCNDPACFGKRNRIAMPDWTSDTDHGDDEGSHAKVSSSSSSTSTSSSSPSA